MILLLILDSEADRAMLSDLFRQNYHRMKRVAMGILSESDAAEDAVQDTFVRCIRRVDQLKALPERARASYLLTAVKHNALNRKKQSGAHERVPLEAFDLPDPGEAVDELAIRSLTVATLVDALKRLPETYRDVLRFKYLLELSDAEIANALDVEKSTVRVYLMRARRALLKLCEVNDHA